MEVVRSMYEAYDRAGVDGMIEFISPEVDHRAIEGAPDDVGVIRGHEAMRQYFGQWVETFDDLGVTAEELIDAGDQVVSMIHVTARMKESDAEIDMRLGVVWTVRDGKLVRGREYATREEALAVVGLRE